MRLKYNKSSKRRPRKGVSPQETSQHIKITKDLYL